MCLVKGGGDWEGGVRLAKGLGFFRKAGVMDGSE